MAVCFDNDVGKCSFLQTQTRGGECSLGKHVPSADAVQAGMTGSPSKDRVAKSWIKINRKVVSPWSRCVCLTGDR
jgi:hypothetical protein